MKNTFCYVAVRTRLELVTPCVTRSREATDLQSARFNHLPTYPSTGLCQEVTPAGFKPATF